MIEIRFRTLDWIGVGGMVIIGLRSSKSTFGGNNYIDFFVRLIFRDWVLRNWVSLEYYLTVIEVNPEKK